MARNCISPAAQCLISSSPRLLYLRNQPFHIHYFFSLCFFSFITSCDNRFEGEYWGSVAVESEKVAASKKVEDVINAETLNTAKGTKGGREGWGARERGCGGDLS